MTDVPGLKLIQAVDPTKIKVTINEKFSKLTLSSNKKKKLAAEHPKEVDPIEVEKRRSASRNLMDELVVAGEGENENEGNVLSVNAILRSSSLSGMAKECTHQTDTLTQIYDVKIEDISVAAHESMERLQMSDDLTQEELTNDNENELEELTQKVSDMVVSKVEKNMRLSAGVIDLSSSDDEESVICVSDTSVESDYKDCLDNDNFMEISEIPSSAETDTRQLPCTLSNARADRIEAFLRDVSMEQRNMQATGRLPDDSILVHLPPEMGNVTNNKYVLDSAKAKIMATADTESMSATDTEPNGNQRNAEQSLNTPKQRNIALDDTEAMTEFTQATLHPQEFRMSASNFEDVEDDVAKRLANDDTEANTTVNSFENSFQSDAQKVEDSVVISETSSDDEDNSHSANAPISTEKDELVPSENALSDSLSQFSAQHSQIGLSLGSINISAKINIKLQIKADFSASEEETNESDGNSSPDNSQESVTDEEGAVDEVNTKEDGNFIKGNGTITDHNKDKSQTSIKIVENQKNMESKDAFVENLPSDEVISDKNPDSPKNDVIFMGQAQKMLTELYGNSWQTPEIMRTLKRTSADVKSKTKLKSLEKKKSSKTLFRDTTNNTGQQNEVEESLLADFSIFRHDIVQTNLDSTRMTTPKMFSKAASNVVRTEPKAPPKKDSNKDFKVPETELKRKTKKTAISKTDTKNARWRELVDNSSDSDQNNITDDLDVDKTVITDDEEEVSNASDSSWRKSSEYTSDEDMDLKADIKKLNKTKSKHKRNANGNTTKSKIPSKERLIYMDLSKDEVTILEDTPNNSPPVNKDENFRQHLSQILDSCRFEEKPKLVATPTSTGKSKRRLFTVSYSDEIDNESITAICRGETPKKKDADLLDDENAENVRFNGEPIPRSFNIFNKPLEAVKTGKPVYKLTPKETRTPIASREEGTPFRTKEKPVYQTPSIEDKRKLDEISSTPSFKYSFLKSLDVCVGKALCHPDALVFRENYRQKKEDLAKILYELYNSKLFGNNLNVPLLWNKKLLNTAGRCLNKKKLGQRMSVVELSEKVLTSADRLRCTLIHELCHAATWIFSGEGGHGATWKEWARKANAVFPDLPKIGVCHQYDIEYKYTYKCTLCAAKSHYHSKSKKVENIRCSYCYGAIEIFLNKKDKHGNIMPTPVKEPTGFAKFVKEKYQQYKRPDLKHADVMKLLSNEFATLKVAGNAK